MEEAKLKKLVHHLEFTEIEQFYFRFGFEGPKIIQKKIAKSLDAKYNTFLKVPTKIDI